MNVSKILVLGDGAVGKTTIVRMLGKQDAECESKQRRTVMFDFAKASVDKFELICFDIAGQSSEGIYALKEMNRFILGEVKLILLVFSLNNLSSLLNLNSWYEQLLYSNKKLKQQFPPIIIVGNKLDKEGSFDDAMVKTLVSSNSDFFSYVKVSCLTKSGLNDLEFEISHHLEEKAGLKL